VNEVVRSRLDEEPISFRFEDDLVEEEVLAALADTGKRE
jgi:hypothetical protein